MTLHKYGFGIVDCNGNPWLSEACVAPDRECLDDVCADLNDRYNGSADDKRRPYKVVRLYWRGLSRPTRKEK